MEENTFEKFSDWFNVALVKNDTSIYKLIDAGIPHTALSNYSNDLELPGQRELPILAEHLYTNESYLRKLVEKTEKLIKKYKEKHALKDPSYYAELSIQPKDVISAWGLGRGFYLGSAIEKIARAGNKEGESFEKDIRKAIRYLEFALEEK